MAITAKFYAGFFTALGHKEIHLNNDTLKLMLTTSSYVPNQDTHDYKNDVTNEVTGTGYTAGGVAVGSIVFAYNTTTNVWSFDGVDAAWTTITLTAPGARTAVLYDDTPSTAATKPLIGYLDLGQDFLPSAGNFSVTWDSTGIGAVTIA